MQLSKIGSSCFQFIPAKCLCAEVDEKPQLSAVYLFGGVQHATKSRSVEEGRGGGCQNAFTSDCCCGTTVWLTAVAWMNGVLAAHTICTKVVGWLTSIWKTAADRWQRPLLSFNPPKRTDTTPIMRLGGNSFSIIGRSGIDLATNSRGLLAAFE